METRTEAGRYGISNRILCKYCKRVGNVETDDFGNRSLSLIVSTLIFTYHAATAYLCTYLPSDPLYVSVSVSGYAWYGCVLSLLGVVGSIKVCHFFIYCLLYSRLSVSTPLTRCSLTTPLRYSCSLHVKRP